MPSRPSRKSVNANMRRAVLDTNIWVSTFLKPHGYYARMVKAIAPYVALFTAEEILAEVREASLRPEKRRKYQMTDAVVDRAIAGIRAIATVITDLPQLTVIAADPDDNIIVACAVKAHAEYLVSYDPHLKDLREYQGIKIIEPKEFIDILRREDVGFTF